MAEVTGFRVGKAGSLAFVVIVACAILLLTGLGVWQVQRGAWKTALLAELDAREAAAPIDLTRGTTLTANDLRFRRLTARGTVLPKVLRLHHVQDGTLGYKAVMPLVLDGTDEIVLVDTGFVRGEMEGQVDLSVPRGPVPLVGFARFHEGRPSRFTPDNVPEANRWFWWDRAAMLSALQLDASQAAPLTLQLSVPVSGLQVAGTTPAAYVALPRPHNRHAGYAITWFGLALVVAGALIAWVWQRYRARPMNPPQSRV